ncbi:DUF4270 family protein [Neolewinella persica]|uniref:DUF4270 family protein n=1 Tax=Neolewinella persica TaxID=70998 RepID=UPI000382BB3B|nr:DUF4270 family protein [Neolewinella persica]
MKQTLFYLSALVFIVLTSCTEPITVGNDLLDGDRANVGQTTDVPFTTRVVRDDSLLTFDAASNVALSGFTFGRLQDDVFGTWTHSAYLVPSIPRSTTTGLRIAPPFAFTERMVDSVVLILPIDTSYAFYGPDRTFGFKATTVSSIVDLTSDYYADVSLPNSPDEINAEGQFSATRTPAILYDTIYTNGDTATAAHIRIRFDDDFLAMVNSRDETTFQNDTMLATLLAGVFIEPTDDVDGLVGIRPLLTAGSTPFTGFHFFYRDTSAEMTPRIYRMPLSLWLPQYRKSFTGSLTGDLLANGSTSTQLAIGGQESVMIEITLTDLAALDNKVINQAEIKFFQEIIEGYAGDLYTEPEFLSLYYNDDEGNLISIRDRQLLSQSAGVLDFLGGDAQRDENDNLFFRNRFSVHLQEMIEGIVPNKIYLRVVPTDRDPSRVILRGPGATELPASIKVTFTEIGN